MKIFKLTDRPADDLFFRRGDLNDLRLGEIVSAEPANYERAEIVILGCPQDEGVRRNKGRAGASRAPDEIRKAFYKLTDFGIGIPIFDLGNAIVQPSLEETHDLQIEIVRHLIRDGKKIVSLGGGNDISYPDCRALSAEAGAGNLLVFNIDAHFDVRDDVPRNSGTPYRQLLEEKWILPESFYEIGWQRQANSAVYFEYLKKLAVNLIGLDEFQIEDFITQIEKNNRQSAIGNRQLFWGFDVDAVRASDAPGVSAPNPIGLTGWEFCRLAELAGSLPNTRVVEFTEVNPGFDIDGRTARLTAIAMHRFCAAASANSMTKD
jgi:formiminoglutamase